MNVMTKNIAVQRSVALFLGTLAVIMTPTIVLAQDGYGQVSLNNQTSSTADLYVDGVYACRALSRLFCTTQVRVGMHNLEAKLTDGRSTTQNDVVVEQGGVRTFTIQDN